MNPFKGFKTFLSDIFKDVDDGFSAKRTGFFIFIMLIVICTLASLHGTKMVDPMIFNGLVDLVKWIGAAILGERTPAALAAFRGAVIAPEKKD